MGERARQEVTRRAIIRYCIRLDCTQEVLKANQHVIPALELTKHHEFMTVPLFFSGLPCPYPVPLFLVIHIKIRTLTGDRIIRTFYFGGFTTP